MPRINLAALAALALVVASAAPAVALARERPAPGSVLTGRVTRVRDGDTIVVGDVPVRLQGVAAPELRDPLGREAGRFMRRLADGAEVRCELDGTRSWDRVVGVCRLAADGSDLGAAVIARGLARDCPHFSKGRYAPVEAQATAAGSAIRAAYRLPRYCC